jgi:hypothetical protein
VILDRPIPIPVPGGTFSWRVIGPLGGVTDLVVDEGTVIADNYEHEAVADATRLLGVREPAPARTGWMP